MQVIALIAAVLALVLSFLSLCWSSNNSDFMADEQVNRKGEIRALKTLVSEKEQMANGRHNDAVAWLADLRDGYQKFKDNNEDKIVNHEYRLEVLEQNLAGLAMNLRQFVADVVGRDDDNE